MCIDTTGQATVQGHEELYSGVEADPKLDNYEECPPPSATTFFIKKPMQLQETKMNAMGLYETSVTDNPDYGGNSYDTYYAMPGAYISDNIISALNSGTFCLWPHLQTADYLIEHAILEGTTRIADEKIIVGPVCHVVKWLFVPQITVSETPNIVHEKCRTQLRCQHSLWCLMLYHRWACIYSTSVPRWILQPFVRYFHVPWLLSATCHRTCYFIVRHIASITWS